MKTYQLPPLSSLRSFEAVARLASFKAASAELFVTPTAVSHQIRQLEEYLGVRVLQRTPRGATLTLEGQVLYQAVSSGLSGFSQAVTRLKNPQKNVVLTLSATGAFLSHWIVPRLSKLRLDLPNLELRLHTSEVIEELKIGEIETAIRYGNGPSLGVAVTPLKNATFGPVCSPSLKISSLNDLCHVDLIHFEGRYVPRLLPDWPRWCRMVGATHVNTKVGMRFTEGIHAVQATIAGQGVAIVSLELVADLVASGLLVQPFSEVLAGEIYHFVCANAVENRADVVALRNWFIHEMGTPLTPHLIDRPGT